MFALFSAYGLAKPTFLQKQRGRLENPNHPVSSSDR